MLLLKLAQRGRGARPENTVDGSDFESLTLQHFLHTANQIAGNALLQLGRRVP